MLQKCGKEKGAGIRYGVDAKNALTNASTRIDNSSSIHAIRLREALSSSCFGL
jgi:hypothetical protein